MKNIVVIFAGGTGQRMGTDIPKQFLKVNEKSLYLYTVEKFQNNNNIDKIIILICILLLYPLSILLHKHLIHLFLILLFLQHVLLDNLDKKNILLSLLISL